MVKVFDGKEEVYIWPDQIIYIKPGHQNRGCYVAIATNKVFSGGTTAEGFTKIAEEARNNQKEKEYKYLSKLLKDTIPNWEFDKKHGR